MRYVAFLDILGFTKMVENLEQQESVEIITKFSGMIYDLWNEMNLHNDDLINGFIVSDCAIIYTSNCNPESLKILINFLCSVFKISIFKKSLMLRAAITKGEFDDLTTTSFSNLGKRLIVGDAYVKATQLESRFKGAKILFGNDVFNDYIEISDNFYLLEEIKYQDDYYYSVKWATVDELCKTENIESFIRLAIRSKWMSHYYQTLSLFLSGNVENKVRKRVFDLVWKTIIFFDNPNKYYRDLYINNAFSSEVDSNYKKMFIKYLRDKVDIDD